MSGEAREVRRATENVGNNECESLDRRERLGAVVVVVAAAAALVVVGDWRTLDQRGLGETFASTRSYLVQDNGMPRRRFRMDYYDGSDCTSLGRAEGRP